jgi:hypothetical protein
VIDFRYHLVSIVSIFLALAVGIVLGAGPLKGEIGATLEDEVAGLRADKAQLNEGLDTAQRGVEARDAYISAVNPTLLAGRLEGRSVALVVLPGVDSGIVETTATTLGGAGASVVSTTSLTEDWVSADTSTESVRSAVVSRVAGTVGLEPTEQDGVAPRDTLLAAMLTASTDPEAATVDPTQLVRGLGALQDAGLLSVEGSEADFRQAELVVVLSDVVTNGDQDARTAEASQWVDLTVAMDARATGTVLGAQVVPGVDGVWVMTVLRDDTDAASAVSGVDDVGQPMGQSSIVDALVEQAAGGAGQYGLAAGASTPYAPLPTATPTASSTPTSTP